MRTADQNAILQALQSTGALGASSAASGVDALNSSVQNQQANFDLANTGAAGQQAANQASIDNARPCLSIRLIASPAAVPVFPEHQR